MNFESDLNLNQTEVKNIAALSDGETKIDFTNNISICSRTWTSFWTNVLQFFFAIYKNSKNFLNFMRKQIQMQARRSWFEGFRQSKTQYGILMLTTDTVQFTFNSFIHKQLLKRAKKDVNCIPKLTFRFYDRI